MINYTQSIQLQVFTYVQCTQIQVLQYGTSMKEGWCDTVKVRIKRKGNVKRRNLQACTTKEVTELDQKVCCEISVWKIIQYI